MNPRHMRCAKPEATCVNRPVCANCDFYNGPTGECRKYAPSLVGNGLGGHLRDWVHVEPDDWCGEFEIEERSWTPVKQNERR